MTVLHGLSNITRQAVLNSLPARQSPDLSVMLSEHVGVAVLYCLLTTLYACLVVHRLTSALNAQP